MNNKPANEFLETLGVSKEVYEQIDYSNYPLVKDIAKNLCTHKSPIHSIIFLYKAKYFKKYLKHFYNRNK